MTRSSFDSNGFYTFGLSTPVSTGDSRDRKIAELEHELKATAEIRKVYETFKKQAFQLGVIVERFGTRALVKMLGGGAFSIELPPNAQDLKRGDLIQAGEHAAFGGRYLGKMMGEVATVSALAEGGRVCVEIEGRPISTCWVADGLVLEPGDRVSVVDNCVAIEKLPSASTSGARFLVETEDVDWADVIGQPKAREALEEAVVAPALHPELYAAYGQKPPRGVVLSGPPGCGKSMLARAVATQLRRDGRGGAFFYVKGPEVLSKWLGESERTIREIFRAARLAAEEKGSAVIFLDEADALLGDRSGGRVNGVEQTVVPQFLTELDGATARGNVFAMIATNRPDLLDPAVTRDGRFDRRVKVERPTSREDVERLLAAYLARTCVHPAFAAGAAVEIVMRQAVRAGGKIVKLNEVMSGALARGLVERAARFAIRRELAGAGERGVTAADFTRAVEAASLEVHVADVAEAHG